MAGAGRTARPLPHRSRREGITTGISAADRATTIRAAVAEDAVAEDIVSPGHVFPLIARDGGVWVRSATEAAIDLCRMAGVGEAAVLCAVLREDGSMARAGDMGPFLAEHGMASVDLDDLLAIL
jgi:3,4-dihydroxy 2-butanone 4-phosphate synthase/GTP cyclohydrolase II